MTHYFADKREMLLWAYRTLGEIGLVRFEGVVIRKTADLVEVLMALTAAHAPESALWRTYIAIWDTAFRDPALAAELRSWDEKVVRLLARCARELDPACAEPERAARRLLALVQGVSVQRLFSPQSWPLDAVRHAFESEIGLLIGQGG